jgi:chromosome segregation ATPase
MAIEQQQQQGNFVVQQLQRLDGDVQDLKGDFKDLSAVVQALKHEGETRSRDLESLARKVDHIQTEVTQVNTSINSLTDTISGELGLIQALKDLKVSSEKSSRKTERHAGMLAMVSLTLMGVLGYAIYALTGVAVGG